MSAPLARRARAVRAWVIYRLDRLLEAPPFVQIALVAALTAIGVLGFALLEQAIHGDAQDLADASWWALTRFADGGTMADDPPALRALGALVSAAGIFTLALLTAALTSKMGERITQLRAGLVPVVTHDHVLVLGFAPNVPLLARELARSHQRVTLVVLTTEPRDRVELALRAARSVPGHRLTTIVRTGEPRFELALMRVAADRARAIVVIPPSSLDDESSVRWTLGALLALRRVMRPDTAARVLVEARHEDARDLLSLAAEPALAGPGALPTRVIGTDRVIAQILAHSTRGDGLYFVLRHLLAFDGCEVYVEPLPASLVDVRFDDAFASIDRAVLIGVLSPSGALELTPEGGARLRAGSRLVVIADGPRRARLGGVLPPAPTLPTDATSARARPSRVSIIGHNATLPHLLEELSTFLEPGSSIKVRTRTHDEHAEAIVAAAARAHPQLELSCQVRSPSARARDGDDVCEADALVILGEETTHDENGDASALATLLRLRRAMRDSGEPGARIVTEVRDPISAMHLEPRPGDAVVSSDVVAMLLAQGVMDPTAAPVYDELLGPRGASLELRPIAEYVAPSSTFADLLAAARARGEIALGIYPDPRTHLRADEERRRLEEGDARVGGEAWLNPPRGLSLPADPATQVALVVPLRRPVPRDPGPA